MNTRATTSKQNWQTSKHKYILQDRRDCRACANIKNGTYIAYQKAMSLSDEITWQ